jgi:hypothetical protein
MIDDGNAVWWWSGFAGATPEPSWPDGNTDEYRTWDEILDAFPNAEVLNEDFTGQFLIRAGHPGPDGLQGNVDNIMLGSKYMAVSYDFEAIYPTSGKILKPYDGQKVSGELKLKASYDDGDDENDDLVQWAVRQGTCDVNPDAVVFGNTAGHDDEFEWDGQKFSSKLDIRALDEGEYCFIFNPTDDPGQNDVRETQTFFIKQYEPKKISDCFWNWDDYLNPSFEDKGECIKYVMENGSNFWKHWGWWFWGGHHNR